MDVLTRSFERLFIFEINTHIFQNVKFYAKLKNTKIFTQEFEENYFHI